MSTSTPFALYNPAMLPPDVLLAEFTARRPLLATLLNIIRANGPGEPPQHVLVMGPRGMGKTTLLWAIAGSLALREPELARIWQAVPFDEESRRIGDLADFWLECIRQWEAATAPSFSTNHSPRIAALLARPGPDLEDQARETFLRLVDASGKRALLLVDNLNDIFAAVHDTEALLRLRSFLMADSRVMIIGAATRWFTDVTGLDKPFFEFFRPFELRPLDLAEMRDCLAGVAEARGDAKVLEALKNRAGTIEALHVLTGGNPRLIRTFYRLLAEGMNGELRQQLERLIDDYTPYHKAIIDALPGQQQRVLDAIALHWNPCDVASVALATRLPSNQVSAQIKALVKGGLVSEVPALGTLKKKAYLLTDRFSNIHYLMRHGRAGRLKLHWYVMTLRSLFDDQTFADSVAQTVRQTAAGSDTMVEEGLLLAQNALSCAGSETARRRMLDRLTGSPEFDTEVNITFAEKLCEQAIRENPQNAYAHFKLGRLLQVHLKRLNEAEEAYQNAIRIDPKFSKAWINLGTLLAQKSGCHLNAEQAYMMAIKLDPTDSTPWFGLARLLTDKFGRFTEAEEAYHKAIKLDPSDAASYNNLGYLLANKLNRFSEAEEAYKMAIQIDSKNPGPLLNLGFLLSNKLGRYYEAEQNYLKAIDLEPNNSMSWNNLGTLLYNYVGRESEAEKAYRKAVEIEPKNALPWNNLGNLLMDRSCSYSEAEDAFRKSVQLAPHVAAFWINLGNFLTTKLGRHAEADETYRKAIQLAPKLANSYSALAHLHFKQKSDILEARKLATRGLLLKLDFDYGQYVYRTVCFSDAESLLQALAPLSLWSTQHYEDSATLAFALDAWVAYAKVATPKMALQLLEAQPDEVKLAFESVRDAFVAHENRDYLHQLAPERRAPVLKLLERIGETLNPDERF